MDTDTFLKVDGVANCSGICQIRRILVTIGSIIDEGNSLLSDACRPFPVVDSETGTNSVRICWIGYSDNMNDTMILNKLDRLPIMGVCTTKPVI